MPRIEMEFGANFEKYYSDVNKAIAETKNKMTFIEKGFADEIVATNIPLEELTSNIGEFVKMNNLNEMQLKNVIQLLEKQKSVLTVGSEAYKSHEKAIGAINQSMNNHSMQAGIMRTNQNSMNQALSQFGWVLGDANMFMVNFRMGMQSIGNNIPMVVQGFAQASAEAKNLDISVGRHLLNSLKGFGGIMLGVNGIMFLLQVLPELFGDTTKEVKKQADEVAKLKDEYSKLTREQINNQLTQKETALKDLEGKYPNTTRAIYDPELRKVVGSRTMTASERFGADFNNYQNLQNSIKALKEARFTLGDIENVENRLSINRQRLNDLNKDNLTLYKDVGANYDEIKKKLEGWIAADEKLNRNHSETIAKIKKDLTDLSLKGFTAQTYFDFLQNTPLRRNPRTPGSGVDLTGQSLKGFTAESYFNFLQGGSYSRNPRDNQASDSTDEATNSAKLLGMAWSRTGDIMNSALSEAIGKMKGLSDIGKQLLATIVSMGLSFFTGGLFGAIGGKNFLDSGLAALGMANGGVINEPIFGVGRSGRSYMFGEAGSEVVIPANRFGGASSQPAQNINIQVGGTLTASGKELHALIKRIDKLEKRYS